MLARCLIVAAAFAIAAATIYFTGDRGDSIPDVASSEGSSQESLSLQSQSVEQPSSEVAESAVESTDRKRALPDAKPTETLSPVNGLIGGDGSSGSALNVDSRTGQSAEQLGIDVYELAAERFESDAQFEELALLLEQNPAFRAELFEQFRYETDPERLKRLSQLLGRVDDPLIPQIASEMVFSGNSNSQKAAMDLLRRVQEQSPDARNVLIDILAAESQPEVLSAALNAVSNPGNADSLQRQTVMANVTSLAQHEDPIIRARSIGVLTKWAENEQVTPLILQGLNDSDPKVRQTAAYSLVDYPFADNEVINSLLDVAENSDEGQRTRRGAMLALNNMQLSAEERQRLETARTQVNRTR